MYEYEIIDTSTGKMKKGKATLAELSHIIPFEIYGQLKLSQTIELKVQAGSEVYIIKKI